AGQLAHRDVADTRHEPGLDDERRTGARAAHEGEARGAFVLVERGRRMRALLDLALEDARLAGAADAVLASVRQHHRLAQRRVEDALVGSRVELAAARQNPDPETHRCAFLLRIMAGLPRTPIIARCGNRPLLGYCHAACAARACCSWAAAMSAGASRSTSWREWAIAGK